VSSCMTTTAWCVSRAASSARRNTGSPMMYRTPTVPGNWP